MNNFLRISASIFPDIDSDLFQIPTLIFPGYPLRFVRYPLQFVLDIDSEEQPDEVPDYKRDDGHSQADAGHFQEPFLKWEILGH